ncbi:iron-sulfur cluster assembly protein NAR1 [Sporobolomyces salmoneus]|uniref:iron-sulfur cluster assembly protein NAR1 n=1 Tax=Sporobolomyces salmoneus TaxID=183962 RepID=UPI0031770D42
MSLSSGLTLTDLSDYLAPSQACIKPVTYVPDEDSTPSTPSLDKPAAAAATEIVIGDDSGFYERGVDGEKGKKLKKAEITLNDCLACSGCITSAESVLVTMQSHEEVYRVLTEQPELTPIVSISPQSVASLAALYDLTLTTTMRGLRRFFKEHLGFRLVFDTTFPRALSLLESRLELAERRSHAASSSSSSASTLSAPHTALEPPTKLTPSTSSTAPLPILSSACPGWICYAEKTHGDLLPFVSAIKSPQSISGVLVKSSLVAGRLGKVGKEIYHVAVMPCYDKKLEASRPDFTTKHLDQDGKEIEVRDVDLVLTTGEVARMLSDKSLSLRSLALEPSSSTSADPFDGSEELDYFPFSHLSTPPSGTSSGSYVQTAISSLISSLPRSTWSDLSLTTKTVRNEDYIEYTLSQRDSNGEKEIVGKAAKCYGFRNLQNVVRKIGKDAGISVTRGAAGKAPSKASAALAAANAKRAARLGGATASKGKEKEIEFIEVMACPSGCVNGGGQVAPPKESLRQRKRRRSWGNSGEGGEYVGRVDHEGMPDVMEQEKAEIMEGEVKMVMDEQEEDRVLSSKDWVKEVERRYWGDGTREDEASRMEEEFRSDLAQLDPSIVPYILAQPTRKEEEAMRRILEQLVDGAEDRQRQRTEFMRTSYRAVESEEINGLAVKW